MKNSFFLFFASFPFVWKRSQEGGRGTTFAPCRERYFMLGFGASFGFGGLGSAFKVNLERWEAFNQSQAVRLVRFLFISSVN